MHWQVAQCNWSGSVERNWYRAAEGQPVHILGILLQTTSHLGPTQDAEWLVCSKCLAGHHLLGSAEGHAVCVLQDHFIHTEASTVNRTEYLLPEYIPDLN